MKVYIPIQLGPRTKLWDIVFEGNVAVDSKQLLEIAEFPLGGDFSRLELEAAGRRLLAHYHKEGYAYASVRTAVEYSPDRSRARARFIINEHKPVIISGYEIRGAIRTDKDLILKRLALCSNLDECPPEERYYKRDLVRESEENIALLGTFSSVSIGLEDPEIPQEHKRVIITVAEQITQHFEPSGGFSTGEGFRGSVEYGHINIAGEAISLTLRFEFALLPDFLILDEDVAKNYREQNFPLSERLERRNSGTLRFPEIGLGPKVDLTLTGIDLRDNQRDFALTRQALVPMLSYRPTMQINLQLGTSAELNDVNIFGDVEAVIEENPSLARVLSVPEGRTIAFSQRASANWDRRDNPVAATEGTLASAAVEHVSAFPMDDETEITSEFIRLTGRAAGYLRLTDKGMAIALSLSGGINVQLKQDSLTYPDRLFYLGGVNTIRGFSLDSLVPEDVAQKVLSGEIDSVDEVGVRGGDLMINPRGELRVPLTDTIGAAVFVDTGNLWVDVGSVELVDLFKVRYTTGLGLRFNTAIGPIAFDYGFNLVRREWEDLGALHFSIGLF